MKTIITIIVLVIIGFIGYNYVTRDAAAPSQDVQDIVGPASAAPGTYRITSATSLVSFKIDEVLRGEPYSPIGTTSAIAGDITVSSSSVTFGNIAVNARTFVTDSPNRNGAIARFILKSETAANEFIMFKTTSTTGLPATIPSGTPVTFKAMGDLTIAGVTKPATFDITMTVGESAITGTASAALKRSTWGLVVPSVTFVASVSDDFTVSADITADKAR